MKKILLAAFSLGSFFAGAQDPAPCTELFISEYIEGTSNNKALELYNPTSNPINLSAYSIKIYFNGSSTAGATFVPAGTLAAGQTFTIAHASATIFTGPDTTLGGVSVVSFNGNDALELLNGTTVIDVIGIVGVDPITNWAVGSGATNEFTLVRKSTVHNGYTNWTGSADTTYDVYPQNTVLYFGSHTIDPCPALAVTADFDFTGLCLSDTVYFTNTSYGGTGPYTFAWDFADGNISTQENPSHVFPTAGCYDVQLIVTDGLGDDDTIIQTVCVLATGDPMVTTADSVLCNDSFGMFLDADDTTGTWTGTYVSDSGNGDGFFSSAAIPPGTYYAIYTTGGSCPGTDTVVITVPTTPTAGFTYMVTGSTITFTNTSTNADGYLWDFDGLGTSTATDTSFTFPGPGSFYVCLNAISDSGCNALFCQNITITGLNETGDENTLTIYPNPATDYITVNGKYTVLIIRNGLGDNVINKEHLNGSERLYIGQLPAGVYSLVVDNKRSYKLLISAR